MQKDDNHAPTKVLLLRGSEDSQGLVPLIRDILASFSWPQRRKFAPTEIMQLYMKYIGQDRSQRTTAPSSSRDVEDKVYRHIDEEGYPTRRSNARKQYVWMMGGLHSTPARSSWVLVSEATHQTAIVPGQVLFGQRE